MKLIDKFRSNEKYQIFGITFLLHIFIFICLYGVSILNIAYTDWMMDTGDLGLEYFGALFFAHSDWRFPIGLMDGLSSGLQSIVYFDGLPILAIIGKLLRGILPHDFQLFGIYSLLVFGMQGVLGAFCVYKFVKSKWVCIAVSFLFSMQMIFLSHVLTQIPLSSHWILLVTFLIALYYEQLDKKKRILCIIGILVAAIFVQTAFLPMVLCILFFRMLAEILIKRNKKTTIENILFMLYGVISIVFSSWILGMFHVTTNTSGGGLGTGALRFDSFIDSMGVSLFLPARSSYKLTEAAYLGLGVLGLLIITIIIFVIYMIREKGKCLNKSERIYLLCAFFAMVISIFFALSPIAKWGKSVVYEIPLSDFFYKLWSTVRSSYRLAWSVVYGIIILILWAMSKVKYKWKNMILVIFALIQIVDMIPMLVIQNAKIEANVVYESPFQSEAWEKLAENRDKILFMNADCRNNALSLLHIVGRSGRPVIYSFAYYANENDMKMNDFYYARKDSAAMNEQRTGIWNELYKGNVDEQAIYIFLETPVRLMLQGTLNFYQVDGYLVGIADTLDGIEGVEKYNVGEPVSILPVSTQNALLYAEGAEFNEEGGRVLHSQGKSYGPQVSLEAGRYLVRIEGSNLESADVACESSKSGQIPIENIRVSDEWIEYEIELSDITYKIDFIVENLSEQDIVLEDMTIEMCDK